MLKSIALTVVAIAACPAAGFGQSAAEVNAAILARVNSPANFTNRVLLDASGPTITIINSRAEDGPFGPLVLTPIVPLSRQPYGYWPDVYPYWGAYRGGYVRPVRATAPLQRSVSPAPGSRPATLPSARVPRSR